MFENVILEIRGNKYEVLWTKSTSSYMLLKEVGQNNYIVARDVKRDKNTKWGFDYKQGYTFNGIIKATECLKDFIN